MKTTNLTSVAIAVLLGTVMLAGAGCTNSKTNQECDKTNSMVIIYPKEPYGKKDYRIDTNLVCGFELEETK